MLTSLTEEQDAALVDAFSLTCVVDQPADMWHQPSLACTDGATPIQSMYRDHPTRGELRALAHRLGISDFLIRTAFQALRSRMRRNLAKATKKVAVVKAGADTAEATPVGPSAEALMQSITTNRSHDEALGVQLRLLVSSSTGGGVAQASFVPLFVALMTSAKTPGLRASLSDAVTASGSCSGVWPALLDNRVVDVLATWLSDAERSRHTTLLRKFVAAAFVLPVSKPEQVAPLASPLNKCRQYRTAKDVSDSATQLLAHWGRAFSGLGPGPSSKLAMAGRLPPRSAGQLPLGPQLAAPPAANTFTGPALSQAALAARIATPAPVVAKRSVDERLAGVNERAAATARPMSADDILKKRRMAAQQSGGLMAAPLVKRNRGPVAAQPMPPPRAQPPPRPEPQLVDWQQPPPMAAAVGDGYGSLSEEAGLQAARQAAALPAQYALTSLIPDDPALPLHVRHEAAQHAEHPPPFIIPDVPVEAEDAAQQVSLLSAAFPGLHGLAPPPPAWQ